MEDALQEFIDAVKSTTGKTPRKLENGEYKSLCPAHNDTNPSLYFKLGDKGRVVTDCKSGKCTHEEIRAALGLNGKFHVEQEPSRPLKAVGTLDEALAGSNPAGVWKYQNANGFDVAAAVRYDKPDGKKSFCQLSKSEAGWVRKGLGDGRPLYRLPLISKSKSPYICVFEGEKCVDMAVSLGFEATTSMAGSSSAMKTDWSPLKGLDVVLFPDKDQAGTKYAADVCAALSQLTPQPRVRIVELPSLEEGEDVVDFVRLCREDEKPWSDAEIGGAISGYVAQTPYRKLKPPDDYIPRPIKLSDIIAEPDPEWVIEKYAARGAITLLNGFWKAGKTTLISLWLKAMSEGGEMITKVAKGRVLVVTEETGNIWVGRKNALPLGDHVEVVFARWMRKPSLEQWLSFVEKIKEICDKNAFDLVIFDPFMRISCCRDENSPLDSSEALAPLVAFKDSRTAVMLVHHSKKGADVSIEQVARGSGELQAFVEIIVNFRRKCENLKDRRRLLSLMSRFPTPQEEIQVSLADDGSTYIAEGTPFEADTDELSERLYSLIPLPPDKITMKEIEAGWKWGQCPSASTLRRGIATLKTAKVIRWEEPANKNKSEKFWKKYEE